MVEEKTSFGAKIKLSFKRIGGYFVTAFTDFRRSPLTVFFTVAYPIILILLFGAIFNNVEENISFTVYYQSEGDDGFQASPTDPLFNYTDTIVSILDNITREDGQHLFEMNIIPLKNANNEAIDPGNYLEEVDGYLAIVFPFNFTQEAIFNPPSTITAIIDENSQTAGIALNIISGLVYDINLGVAGYNESKIGLETVDIFLEEEIEYFEFLIPGIIGVAIMNNGVIGTIQRYSNFDKKGIFRKLSSTPIKKFDLLSGEASWVFAQGLISIIASLLVGWLAFKVPNGEFSWIYEVLDWKMLPITIASVLSFTGMGMIGARVVKNPGAATAVGNFLVFPMMFLSGAFFEISHIPVINVVSKFLPLTYVIDALRASMLISNPIVAWTNIGISMAFGVVLFTIGVLITKITER
ncbi:MAG: ABC transporter permease [Candidatus Heimdallarchaeota archaeon]